MLRLFRPIWAEPCIENSFRKEHMPNEGNPVGLLSLFITDVYLFKLVQVRYTFAVIRLKKCVVMNIIRLKKCNFVIGA